MNTLLVAFLVVAVLAISVNTASVEQQPPADCPKFCTYEYLPVCGYDGSCYHVYGNKCALNVDRCENKQTLRKVDMGMCDQALAKTNPNIKMCEVN